jgi:ABC-type dipeptide/oligopeptide/nickel transport system ATPase component
MIDPATWSMVFNAARAGDTLIDETKRNLFIQKMKWLFTKRKKIVVFGISGTGKTQFINSLMKSLNIPPRTLTTDKINYNLDEFPIVFIDTPGHGEKLYQRKTEIINILKDGVEGIINVISYGYEENPVVNLVDIFDQNGIVKDSALRLNRKIETERLAEWLPLIHPDNINWIINLVNKADLWWDVVDEVNNHYETGDYCTAFNSIDNYSNVITLPYCSIIKPYYDKRTSGLFGEIQKAQMQDNLIHQMLNLMKN